MEGLEPAVNAEEQFVTSFFHLAADPNSSQTATSPSKNVGGNEVRRLMTIIFGSIETELVSFLTHYEKLESRLVPANCHSVGLQQRN